jgi:hypothetical protein
MRIPSGAEEAAEKVGISGEIDEKRSSGAEARVDLLALCGG